MPKYLLKVRYNGDGLAGVMKDGGSARRAAAEALAKEVGGSLESFYFAFGDVDAYCVCDVPDDKAAARIALTVSSSGRVSISTVPLLTVDDIDDIAAAGSVAYRAPGG